MYAGYAHPCCHRRHVEYIAALWGRVVLLQSCSCDHVFSEESAEHSGCEHVEVEDGLNLFLGHIDEWLPEEHAGVVDEDIHLYVVLVAPLVDSVCSLLVGEVLIECYGFDMVELGELISERLQLGGLVADEQEVVLVVASEDSGVGFAYA